ncbi:sigma-70 family RNA polymerase sigma factor [Micromonospora chalcea]|uniref:RNA polymerase sigma factor n=1 Tax=Micromonospora chalcea TaxID=1874 RepID=UPI002378EFA2|nr:sigma-70 family RNA polymerase sigma factor [Micromonospora chalcea]WDQ00108.1 sigma-70 family RNA polymerase sigma factor [Micromonospora chalcea]
MTEASTEVTRQRLTFPPVPSGRTTTDFALFWSNWEPVIRRVSGAKLRRARVPRALADVDDATHSVYVELCTRWPNDDFAGKDPGRYGVGTVLNDFVRVQVDELKRRSGKPAPDNDVDQTAASLPSPEDLYIEREVERFLREAVETAMQQLPDKQRRAVQLTTAGELTREEIAEAMGVSAGAVSSHRTRGLRRLVEAVAITFFWVVVPVVAWLLHDQDAIRVLVVSGLGLAALVIDAVRHIIREGPLGLLDLLSRAVRKYERLRARIRPRRRPDKR